MDTGLPYGSASIIEHENTQRQHKNVIPIWAPRAERLGGGALRISRMHNLPLYGLLYLKTYIVRIQEAVPATTGMATLRSLNKGLWNIVDYLGTPAPRML